MHFLIMKTIILTDIKIGNIFLLHNDMRINFGDIKSKLWPD